MPSSPRSSGASDMGILTPRELMVVAAVASGKRSGAVASDLGVSEATVKTHLHSIYRKLGVTNRVGATVWYLQRT